MVHTDCNIYIELYIVGGRGNWQNATEGTPASKNERTNSLVVQLPSSRQTPTFLDPSCPPGQPANRVVQVFHIGLPARLEFGKVFLAHGTMLWTQ
jgi:hypothetical protein